MSRRLPPLKALRAFEAAARAGSIKDAAAELCVTPSAVSRQIQLLEEYLGVMLFQRFNRGLELTQDGRNYAQGLNQVFGRLQQLTAEIARHEEVLRVLVPVAFSGVLIRRLPEFERRCPRIEVRIETYTGPDGPDFRNYTGDAAITWGRGQWDGMASYNLNPHPYLAVMAAPSLLPDGHMLEDPRELADYAWLCHTALPDSFEYWLHCAGGCALKPKRRMGFDNGLSLAQAAVSGAGLVVTLGGSSIPYLVDPDGDRLTLAHPFHALLGTYSHYFAYRPERETPALAAFRDWLIEAFAARPYSARLTPLELAMNAIIVNGRGIAEA